MPIQLERPTSSLPRRRLSGGAVTCRIVAETREVVDALVSRAHGAGVSGVGLAVPGRVDPATGHGGFSADLGWVDAPLGPELEAALGLPAYVEHDVYAGAPAEFTIGAGRGTRSGAFVPAGTGFGAALLIEGRFWRGADSTGGCSLSVMMTGDDSNRPMEVHTMAQRLCFEERARIEALNGAGFNASEIAVSSGRRPTTVQREPARGGGVCGYGGFATGRSIWKAPVAQYLSGRLDRDATREAIRAQFAGFVDDYLVATRVVPAAGQL